MSLILVKNGMTQAVMFGPDGNNILPAAVLYNKNILAMRGSFRPLTKVNEDMYQKSFQMISNDKDFNMKNTMSIFEITLSNLLSGKTDINEQDFLDRAELLCSTGKTVLLTNFQEYYKLSDYFSNYSKKKTVLAMGVDNLVKVFDENYYSSLSGGILEAFGKLFKKEIEIYLYPMLKENKLINSNNLQVHDNMKNLYKFFKDNNKIKDIIDYNKNLLDIFSGEVLFDIQNKNDGWEDKLPETISELIKEKKLFGFQ
jgi:hypothetical protein